MSVGPTRKRRVGPVEFSEGDASATIQLEFDRAEGPDAPDAYRLFATVLSGELQSAGRLLCAWFKRAGVRWQSERLVRARPAGVVDTT